LSSSWKFRKAAQFLAAGIILAPGLRAQSLQPGLIEWLEVRDLAGVPPLQLPTRIPLDEDQPPAWTYDAPAIYAQWWYEIASCQGLPLPPRHAAVRFVAVNATQFRFEWMAVAERRVHGRTVTVDTVRAWLGLALAVSFFKHDLIVLTVPGVFHEARVKHEMTHFLLYWSTNIDKGHPSEFFGTATLPKCGIRPYGDSSW
jgi:hypothetical protein